MNTIQQCFGRGIEAEGFVLRDDQTVVETVRGVPTVEWLIETMLKKHPGLRALLSPEQASGMVELKTGIHREFVDAVDEILRVRELVNHTLRYEQAQMVFVPVAPKPFRFLPASFDPASHSAQLVAAWGRGPDGQAQLEATATASIQFNDSTHFRGKTTDQVWDIGRKAFNAMGAHWHEITRINGRLKDHQGRSRLELAQSLLHRVKAERFAKKGMPVAWSTIPPHFSLDKHIHLWMCAHSDVENITQAVCKNEHAFTLKLKRAGFFALETRVDDAVDDDRTMLSLAQQRQRLLTRALCE